MASPSSSLDPLPLPWFLFFAYFEPLTTVLGAYFAIFDTDQFYHDLIPMDYKSTAGAMKDILAEATGGVIGGDGAIQSEAKMGMAQLGSCYLLLALLSSFVIPTIRRTLLSPSSRSPSSTAAAEKIMSSMLLALAIADWIHILLTLYYLPPVSTSPGDCAAKLQKLVLNPLSWNGLLAGNVLATLGLFIARSLWFLGVGRQMTAKKGGKKTK